MRIYLGSSTKWQRLVGTFKIVVWLAVSLAVAGIAVLLSIDVVAFFLWPLVLLTIFFMVFFPKGRYLLRRYLLRSSLLFLWRCLVLRVFALVIFLCFMTSSLYLVHSYQLSGKLTKPEQGRPWREGLVARVYWDEPPSQGMQSGFADTVKVLGFNYENVEGVEEANVRIWPDSWAYLCKWGRIEGFASLDPNPSIYGGETGDIYTCRFTSPFKDRPFTDYSVMAHETAHLLAAQPHFGSGLMGEGGGHGAFRFNETEIQIMCNRVRSFHQSVRAPIGDSSSRMVTGPLEGEKGSFQCGSQ